MTRIKAIKLAVISAAMGVVVALAGCSSGTDITYIHWFTPETRIAQSDLVLRAVYMGVEEFEHPQVNPVDHTVLGTFLEPFRKYQPLIVYKGDVALDEVIYVAGETGALFSAGQPVALSVGSEYVLFLRDRPALEGDSKVLGGRRINHGGEPGIAQVVDSSLRILARDHYWEAVEERERSGVAEEPGRYSGFGIAELEALPAE